MSERVRARAYVLGLVRKYRENFPRVPRYLQGFYQNRVAALTRDLEVMQGQGEDGDRTARLWCLVAGC